jgi:hypothetical protein
MVPSKSMVVGVRLRIEMHMYIYAYINQFWKKKITLIL